MRGAPRLPSALLRRAARAPGRAYSAAAPGPAAEDASHSALRACATVFRRGVGRAACAHGLATRGG